MDKIKINIAPVLLTKLNILSSEYSMEVGGYLTGEIKNNEIYLKDLLIPNQIISPVSVNISGQDQINLRKKFGDKVKNIIGHWHSHASMGCFWSGTDEADMKNIMTIKNFFIWVVSSKGNHLIRISQREPFYHDFNDCEFYVKNLTLDLIRKRMDNLIVKNNEIVTGEEGSEEELIENKNKREYNEDIKEDYMEGYTG